MADDDKYNKDGFKLGPKGGVLADPGANLSDNKDFESWDWKQIKAAIVGYAAVPSDGIPHSTPFSDPDSLRYASVVINRARAGLDYLAENIKMQSEALAGENGAWKSGAADAFRSMTLLFAAKLKSKAEQINGGEAVGTNNVPSQLWTSGNYLQWAKDTIDWIDGYYASWVATNGTKMGNGLARISDYPELVTQMGDDMKKVVRILAGQYILNTDKVTPPNPADFDFKKDPKLGDNNSGGSKPPPNLTDPPPGGGDTAKKPPSVDAPPPSGGPTGGGGPKSPPSLNAPKPPGTGAGNFAAKPPSVDAPPGTGGANVPKPPSVNAPPGTGGSNAPKPPSVSVPPPPGSGGANVPKPPSVNAPPGTGGSNVPKPPSVSVPPPPGSGGANVPKPPSVNAPPGTGGSNVPKPVNVPPPVKSGGGSGTGAGLKPPAPLNVSAPPGTEAGAGNPRGNAVKPPVPSGAEWQAPRNGSGTGQSGPGVPPPAVPPGAGGGQPAATDRPDAAGLLGGETAPWEGVTPPSVGGPSEVPSAAAKPEEWAAPPANAQGAPGNQAPGAGFQPPMVPPGAGSGGQPSAADRPDAAGLLGGETEPWLSGADDVSEIDADYAPSSKPESWANAADPVPADAEEEAVTPMLSAPEGPPISSVSDVDSEVEDDAGERATAAPREAEMSAVPAAPPAGWAVTSGNEPSNEPWEISLPPAAAPEGWAARSDVVSPDVSAPTTAAALVAGAATAAGAMTPAAAPRTGANSGGDAPRTRPAEPTPARDADRDSDRAFPVPGIDSVVVVRAAEAVRDTKAWDTGAKDLVLPAAPLPPAVVSSGPTGWGDDFPAVAPKAAEPVGPEPEPTAHATYQRKKPGEAATIVDSWEPPPSCGDEYSLPPEDREAYLASLHDEPEEEDEETEAEPAERSAADLLNASDSSWGGSRAARPTGVLE
ncbi:hypothetical protein AB0H34_17020 [Saccharopolyspora shandongensis]|uniref:hypothetical protein n=1 Tax=Saccharopolyspora shandongensis TaxID=418495 RepID=UPI0033FBDA16